MSFSSLSCFPIREGKGSKPFLFLQASQPHSFDKIVTEARSGSANFVTRFPILNLNHGARPISHLFCHGRRRPQKTLLLQGFARVWADAEILEALHRAFRHRDGGHEHFWVFDACHHAALGTTRRCRCVGVHGRTAHAGDRIGRFGLHLILLLV